MGPVPLRRLGVLAVERKQHFPLFCDVRGKKALVVGGGPIAARRCATLSRFDFSLQLVAPAICPQVQELAERGLVQVALRPFCPADLTGVFLAVAATNDRQLNQQVGQLARQANIWVSVADCREECSFFFPALAETDTLTIGITGTGQDHAAVAQAAGQIRGLLK